jgi:hypothetical protein
MVRHALSTDWKLAMVAALLSESDAAADHMELAAAKFEENCAARGIANILRDRADDIRRAKAHARKEAGSIERE